jgi:hypothetical protein
MITVFVSLLLVVGGLVLFFARQRAGDFDHGDRLSLLPLADDPADSPEQDVQPLEP